MDKIAAKILVKQIQVRLVLNELLLLQWELTFVLLTSLIPFFVISNLIASSFRRSSKRTEKWSKWKSCDIRLFQCRCFLFCWQEKLSILGLCRECYQNICEHLLAKKKKKKKSSDFPNHKLRKQISLMIFQIRFSQLARSS